ncbi:cytochrome c [Marinobacter adhaerens]|uniref:Cytochrome c n=1 Tax=Marinobacter adhaerens TaxID=1033846 RepID=A0A851HSG1_9GAMM|nr:cytochrome c [Marinobacter adhaerens]NWN91907.1 cytochrome c [Marinobacter adhaerens]
MSRQHRTNENFEPFEANNPIPWPVIALALALATWGILTFLYSYMAADESQQQPASQTEQAGSGQVPTTESTETTVPDDGAQLFDSYCASCHQNNGSGVGEAIPPLAGSAWVLGSGEQAAGILLFGIRGPINVQGTTYNGRMPTFGDTLDNKEIAAIVTHIRSSWGNNAGAISADLVQAQRERFRDRTTPWKGGAELNSHFNVARTAEDN